MELIRSDTDYAIRSLIELAREGKALSCSVLAERCVMPKSFAHKILKKLVRAGIIDSRGGRHGGFLLRKPPKGITMLDVVQVIQGDVHVRPCVLNPKSCTLNRDCRISRKWIQMQDGIAMLLRKTTIGDLVTCMA